MITPTMNGNVPASTPSEDQPMPLSRLEIATARPKAPVRSAVRISSARREIIIVLPPLALLDQPALLGRNLLHMLQIVLDEIVEVGAGQERVHLRGLLDIVLPFRRRLHLLHQVDIEGRLVGGDLAWQPYRAWLLILLDVEPLLDTGGNVAPAFGRGDLGPRRQSLRAEDAERPLRAAAPLSEALARIVHVGIDVAAGELHRGFRAALEGDIGQLDVPDLLDHARQHLVGVLRLRAAHLEVAGGG